MIGVCWRSLPVGNLEKETFQEIWNNKNIRRMRYQLLNNERPQECVNCWKMEDAGAVSYRMKINQESGAKERKFCDHLKEFDEKTMKMPYKIPYAEIRLSNKCNLHCRMCSPRFSSCWEEDWGKNKRLREYIKENANFAYNSYMLNSKTEAHGSGTVEKIQNFIKDNSKYLKYLMIGGGEPMLQDNHYKVLDFLKDNRKQITLEYTSNLSTLNKDDKSVLDYWPYFKKIELKVSLDGDPEIYSYIRRKGNYKIPANNIKKIIQSMDSKQLRVCLTCTTSVYNIERLPETMNWFTELGGWAHTSLVLYPEFLSVQILPSELKNKITNKINLFLSDLDNNINWNKNEIWNKNEMREIQKRRIKEFVINCINFMNGKDRSGLWKTFLGFNNVIDKKKNSILNIYPHWKKYC